MILRSTTLFSFLLAGAMQLPAQRLPLNQLEQQLQKNITKVYPACVRMWGYDTVAHQQNSAQFSGVVVNANGLIYTAAHTVVPDHIYKVFFTDGREALARGLGKITVPDSCLVPDVAMMQLITPGPWPYAATGNASALQKNAPCFGISYPETLNQPLPCVRFGYITYPFDEWGYVQNTCKMEPGDSGGPLFDFEGRVIGLHSRVTTPETINCEVPVNNYYIYSSALQVPATYTTLPAADTTALPVIAMVKGISELPKLDSIIGASLQQQAKSCIQISSLLRGRQQTVSATLLSGDWLPKERAAHYKNFIISKSSLVGSDATVTLPGKGAVPATVLARDNANDLVVLSVDAKTTGSISSTLAYPDSLSLQQQGSFLYSPVPGKTGRASVLSSRFITQPRAFSIGFFGVGANFIQGQITLTRFHPQSPANGLLQAGDQVTAIQHIAVTKPEDYGRELVKYNAGDTVVIAGLRDAVAFEKNIILTARPVADHPAEQFAGGKSLRLDGFDKVFAHDAVLTPEECGGPVFDRQGRFLGINIARFSRTACLAIPAATLKTFIAGAL